MEDIELDEKASANVKAGLAALDQGLQTVQQAVGQIQSQKLDLGLTDQLSSTAWKAGNQAIDDIQGKLDQVLAQVQSIKGGL
jgi:uncharacterized phage infection (PIP) family protein YhgE